MGTLITALTPSQEALLPAIRDEWVHYGLSTEPADRPTAEQGIRAAYMGSGLPSPRFIIWLDSPWAGVFGQAVATDLIAETVGAQVRTQVPQVHAQVRTQVHAQVDGQVHQVYDQVRTQVHAQVRTQVHAQVDGQVHQVHDQVHDQVDDQVRTQVGDQMPQVHDQVRAQVYDQVRTQVHAQVRTQVYDQVRTQVDDQVYDQVHGQVHDQVHDQVHQVHAQVHGQVRTQVHQVDGQVHGQVHDWWKHAFYGQHWAGYYSYYAAMEAIGVTGLAPIHGQQQVARSAGWWFARDGFAVVTERPTALHRDASGALHSPDGMAITYPDGWGFWCWHGRRVPAWVIEDPAVARIAAEINVEVRRCAIESLGWERFIREAALTLAGSAPDPGNPGCDLELYDVPERLWGSRVRVLLAWNGTPELDGSRRRFGLTVPATMNNPHAAAAWGYDDPSHPVRVTPEVYAQLARRT